MGLNHQSLEQLIRAKTPETLTFTFTYNPELCSSLLQWIRNDDGLDADLVIGDEDLRKIDYPDLLAEAVMIEVLKRYAENA